ncbi:MAG: MaoC family dehydratase N-terminal domain-containing protein, partial [Deltaproteobacteria bacterium]|nr:MaoC family dehydratase N-terminal domain-containing protein [Deltaproteobacteria bacterium]
PGDVVKAKTIITDVIEKSGKAGTMDFVVMETTYINQNEEPVLRDKCTLVVRR